MKILCAVLALAGCVVDDGDHPPVLPGGGQTSSGIPEPGTQMISGNVCMAEDLIIRSPCFADGVGGLTVSLGTSTTTTLPDGSFTLPMPVGSPLAFTVSGPGAITTTTPFGPSSTIPVVNADVWAVTMASNQISVPEGAGSILGTVTRDGVPVSGINVVSTPNGIAGPFFDSDAGFAVGSTGSRGVFLVPGLTAGSASLAFSPGESTVSGISVVNGGVTILDSVAIP